MKRSLLIFWLVALSLTLNAQDRPNAFDRIKPVKSDMQKFIQEVERSPDSLTIHWSYLNRCTDKDSAALKRQYKIWMNKYPRSAAFPFSLGKFFYTSESPLAREYLLMATSLDSTLSEAWYFLSVDALRWGDYDKNSLYLKKAVEMDRNNPKYLVQYIGSLKNIPKEQFDSLMFDIELRFTNTEAGANALVYLATENDSDELKRSYFDLLLRRYSESQPPLFRTGMQSYFTHLIKTGDYRSAFELALQMIYVFNKNKLEWKYKLKVAERFILSKSLLDSGRPREALKKLNTISLSDHLSASNVRADESLMSLKAETYLKLDEVELYYDTLVASYANNPTQLIKNTLFKLAAALGKDSSKVIGEVILHRNERGVKATNFTLVDYKNSKKISLSDLQGKIVLLSYWFPGCGPCRAEFPYFESVLKNYDKDKIAYLAVNIYKGQDQFVIPFMQSTGYSFTALKDDESWDKGNLNYNGAPTNYLIDQTGRIIYSQFRIHKGNRKTLELMIDELITRE